MRNYQPQWDSDELESDVDPALRQAVFWHEILQSGPPSAETRGEFESWLRQAPEHAEAWTSIAAVWEGAKELPQLIASRSRKARGAMTRRAFLAGGVGLIGAGSTGGWLSTYPFADIRTAKGEIRHEVLADGSRLEIAGKTALSLDFTQTGRGLTLHRGEVWFDLIRDPGRPFDVRAGHGHIRGDRARFSLATGKTGNVLTVAEDAVVLRLPNAPEVRVQAGSQAVFDGQTTEVAEADLAQSMAWLEGRLIYVSQPMSRIIEGLNRWSQQEIVILSNSLARREATLILDISRVDEALDQLRQAVSMRVVKAPAGMIFIS